MINPDDAEEHAQVWAQVVNGIRPRVSAAPLALLGMAAWIGGNGALLNCCADLLRDRHPGYSMGRLLAEISDGAVSPSVWRAWASRFRPSCGAGSTGWPGEDAST